jgi:hypothetical protein
MREIALQWVQIRSLDCVIQQQALNLQVDAVKVLQIR